ncbi:gp51 [Sodalis phage phiSG1]|nr:gp51 [Sodalis phage phiSG1]
MAMKDKSYAQRRFERTRAHFEKINDDRALARKVSKAWAKITQPEQTLKAYRQQIIDATERYNALKKSARYRMAIAR